MNDITMIYHMNDIDNYVMQLDPTNTILFFDIDNTLLRTDSDICSVEWIKWQEYLFNNNIDTKYLVSTNLTNLYLLYQKWVSQSDCKTIPMEEITNSLLDKYINLGFKIILITARGKNIANNTFVQLSDHYDISHLYTKNIYFDNAEVLYQNGIFFASGIKKGICIKQLLEIINQVFKYKPKNIVFIDDSFTECKSVISEFNKDNINVKVYNYLHGHKYQILFDELNKDDIHKKWIEYTNTI